MDEITDPTFWQLVESDYQHEQQVLFEYWCNDQDF